MRDYSRQRAFNQDKLSQAKVVVIGSGALTNYFCLYTSGLGIKNINIIDDSLCNNETNEFLLKECKGSKVKNLESKIKEINPEMNIQGINNFPLDFLIGNPDVLIDLSNNPETKKLCKEVGKNNRSIKKVISASSSENNGSIRIFFPERVKILKKKKKILHYKKEDFLLPQYKKLTQGNFSSGLISAVVLDEVRKSLIHLEGEHHLREKFDFSLFSKKRFNQGLHFNESQKNLSNLKVLVVGAGGIGTYVCLNLILMGIGRIDLYDGDIVEDHNLNRQVFYYNAINEKKSEVLSYRLNKIVGKKVIKSYPAYLKDTSKLSHYDAIFSCLDNWQYRFLLSDFAVDKKIPFINGSVTAFNAYADFYNCLSCKYDSKTLTENKYDENNHSGSCAYVANSNVVMTNAFVGALMASEIKSIAYPNLFPPLLKKEVLYSSQSEDYSKFTVTNSLLSCLCHKRKGGCKCHENT